MKLLLTLRKDLASRARRSPLMPPNRTLWLYGLCGPPPDATYGAIWKGILQAVPLQLFPQFRRCCTAHRQLRLTNGVHKGTGASVDLYFSDLAEGEMEEIESRIFVLIYSIYISAPLSTGALRPGHYNGTGLRGVAAAPSIQACRTQHSQ